MYQDAIKAGGIAVVTGAASGVGKEAARRFLKDGLDLALVDLPGDALDATTQEFASAAGNDQTVHAMPANVSDAKAMQDVAEAVFGLGPVAALMNNAGISAPTGSWENLENWHRVIEVNLFGVVNGMQAFLPRMGEAARPAVVINTGSKQGITTPPGNPAYNISKAGVKVATEMLAHELREAGVPISAHLFVPGFTYTGMIQRFMPEKPDSAWTSEQAVDYLFDRMVAGDFYILCPDNDVSSARDRKRLAWALGDIPENRPALSRWHPDFKSAFDRHEASD